MQGLHHAGLGLPLTNARAQAIVDPVGDHGPAVIETWAHQIDLVTALRPVLVRPQLAGLGMQGRALQVAVAQGPFFGQSTSPLGKGVVGRHAAIVVQSDDRAGMVIQPLGAVFVTPVTQGQVNHPGFVKHDTPTKMLA